MQDCCEMAKSEASDPGFTERLQKLEATLTRANDILVEIVGHPKQGEGLEAKEPGSITEHLSLRIWQAQRQASTVADQLERLHMKLA